MFLANVLGSVIRGTRRIVQVSLFKKAREIPQALPYGVDSAPVREMVAVYANTADMGNSVIVGYVYKDAVAEVGSIRLYSENGYVYLRANGNLELLGDSKHMVRYEELETGFNSLKQSVTDLVTVFNAHTHTSTAPTTPTSTPLSAAIPPTATITGAKINEIKTL
jgi:hypothetical protein